MEVGTSLDLFTEEYFGRQEAIRWGMAGFQPTAEAVRVEMKGDQRTVSGL
jgi:hypothetical protein